METKSKMGRPKGPEKVYYRKYMTPAQVKEMEDYYEAKFGFRPDGSGLTHVLQTERVDGTVTRSIVEDPNIKALLDDVEVKTKEIVDLKERLDKCSVASDDQKLHWWRMKYEAVVKKYGANEFDQT